MWGSFFLIMMIMKIPRISQLLATSTILSMEDESIFLLKQLCEWVLWQCSFKKAWQLTRIENHFEEMEQIFDDTEQT